MNIRRIFISLVCSIGILTIMPQVDAKGEGMTFNNDTASSVEVFTTYNDGRRVWQTMIGGHSSAVINKAYIDDIKRYPTFSVLVPSGRRRMSYKFSFTPGKYTYTIVTRGSGIAVN